MLYIGLNHWTDQKFRIAGLKLVFGMCTEFKSFKTAPIISQTGDTVLQLPFGAGIHRQVHA